MVILMTLWDSLHESGLSYNPGRSHSLFVETIEDGIIFVYMNKL